MSSRHTTKIVKTNMAIIKYQNTANTMSALVVVNVLLSCSLFTSNVTIISVSCILPSSQPIAYSVQFTHFVCLIYKEHVTIVTRLICLSDLLFVDIFKI